jgi:hypothetical protein
VFGNGIRFVWYPRVAQKEEVVQGALVHHVEAGFMAMEKERLETAWIGSGNGGDQTAERIATGSGHGIVDDGGVDGPATAHAPGGCHHFLDETELDVVGGLKTIDVLLEKDLEVRPVLTFEADRTGEKVGANGVVGRTLLFFGRDRPARAGAVGPRRHNFSSGRHRILRADANMTVRTSGQRGRRSCVESARKEFQSRVNVYRPIGRRAGWDSISAWILILTSEGCAQE